MSRVGVVLILVMVWVAPAVAQVGIGSQIKEVFELTRSAKTEREFTAIIKRCGTLREQTDDDERVKYLTNLLAWSLNKRGELYSAQAVETEDSNDALELDQLALADFEAAVSNDPKRWRALHNRGVSYALVGRHEDAERDFSAAIEINPKYANAWFNRAELRYEAGKTAEALVDYSTVLEQSPGDVGALRGRALCRLELGDPQVAIGDLNTALKAGPDAELLVIRGQAHQSIRRWDAAAADFRAAISQDKNSADAYRSAAWLMAVCPAERVRNPQLAIEAAERTAELEQQQSGQISPKTHDVLGAAHAAAGNSTKAAQHARAALKQPGLTGEERSGVEKRLKLYEQGQAYRVAGRDAGPAPR